MVVDNFDDIDRLERIVPAGHQQPCLVRVIPGVEAATHASQATGHAGSKFGLLPDAAREAIARIEHSAKMRLDGVHTHVGSQLLNVEQLAAAVEPIAKLGTFEVYDLGGGLGVRYTYDEHPPSLDDYADAMVTQARALLPDDCRIIVEPGRSMVANSACTVYRVTTIKRGVVVHVAVDGGMGDNLEVSLTGQRFEATMVDRVGGGEMVSVVGRHCESGDELVDGVPLRDPTVGDLLAVPVTGAYCYTMSNQYNGARRVPVVFARNGNARLVVRRDTWDDLLIRDVDSDAGKIGGMTEPAASLVELARRYGVATEYVDWTGSHATVAESTLVVGARRARRFRCHRGRAGCRPGQSRPRLLGTPAAGDDRRAGGKCILVLGARHSRRSRGSVVAARGRFGPDGAASIGEPHGPLRSRRSAGR